MQHSKDPVLTHDAECAVCHSDEISIIAADNSPHAITYPISDEMYYTRLVTYFRCDDCDTLNMMLWPRLYSEDKEGACPEVQTEQAPF